MLSPCHQFTSLGELVEGNNFLCGSTFYASYLKSFQDRRVRSPTAAGADRSDSLRRSVMIRSSSIDDILEQQMGARLQNMGPLHSSKKYSKGRKSVSMKPTSGRLNDIKRGDLPASSMANYLDSRYSSWGGFFYVMSGSLECTDSQTIKSTIVHIYLRS